MGSSAKARVWYGVGSDEVKCPFDERDCRMRLDAGQENPEPYDDWMECVDEILSEYGCEVIRYGYQGERRGIAVVGTYQASRMWGCSELREPPVLSDKDDARLRDAMAAVGWRGDTDPKWLFAGYYG